MASITYRELLLRNSSFRRLFAGQVVSELGNWFNFIAGLGLVRSVSSASPEAAAIILVARLAPFSLFAPLAGAFVDRWSRRRVMIVTDLARALFALGFLAVRGPGDLWIAYICTAIAAFLTAFFEAAKNASLPNITGENGLLAGNALMFSSRFLLMTVGAALGGATSSGFGYNIAFMVNAASFVISAYSIWLIPEADVRSSESAAETGSSHERLRSNSYWSDIRDGWAFIKGNRLVSALIGVNVLWATGGGALYLVYDRLGGVLFVSQGGYAPDANVAILYTSAGLGLFLGMLLARRVGTHLEIGDRTAGFIGWMLFLHGVIFALSGVAPSLFVAAFFIFLSRGVIGVEFAIQDTLLMRSIPDGLRGRVSITDRAAEILVMSLSTVAAGWSLSWLSVRTLAIISGILSGLPGLMWLWLYKSGRIGLGQSKHEAIPDNVLVPDSRGETT
jgi:predicted MFS family arabinose efflux permease